MDRAQAAGAQLFFSHVTSRVIAEIASCLGPRAIPFMPLKGALLQKLVYARRPDTPRSLTDVDVLVPAGRFREAHAALRDGGFTREHWEGGAWQVAMGKPGLPLGVDLHERLSRTPRARLNADVLFAAARADRTLFGVEVQIPTSQHLWSHLILHGSLHWLNHGQLHHAEDFTIVPEVLGLEPQVSADTLAELGLVGHALLLLAALPPPRSRFLRELEERLGRDRWAQRKAALIGHALRLRPPGSRGRRALALWAGDDWPQALLGALRLRLPG